MRRSIPPAGRWTCRDGVSIVSSRARLPLSAKIRKEARKSAAPARLADRDSASRYPESLPSGTREPPCPPLIGRASWEAGTRMHATHRRAHSGAVDPSWTWFTVAGGSSRIVSCRQTGGTTASVDRVHGEGSMVGHVLARFSSPPPPPATAATLRALLFPASFVTRQRQTYYRKVSHSPNLFDSSHIYLYVQS